ncbi:hypothetical protein F5B19DRAFT_68438 [Rostrohypoxylon terebratum]|nr:hypothetical protein F5B19DRAFT_68438 [Rostrohypoxylon terebratum]
MVQFAYSLVIAAAAAVIASGPAKPASRYIVARNDSGEAPSAVLNDYTSGYAVLSVISTQLMKVTDSQNIFNTVSTGRTTVANEAQTLQKMRDDFVRTGQELQEAFHHLNNDTTIHGTTNMTIIIDSVMRSDLDIQDYFDFITRNATVDAAQDCGAAIACFRNRRHNLLDFIGKLHDDAICNGTCHFNDFAKTHLLDEGKGCDTVFCLL